MREKKWIIIGLTLVVSILIVVMFLLHINHKEKLVWLNSDPCPKEVIDALNDALSEAGCNYIIDYQVADAYDEDYHNELLRMKDNKLQVDILNIGGMQGTDEGNRYLEAIDKGLLFPIEEFLYHDEKGRKLYDIYYEEQWKGLEVDGHIYSYDWRCQPVTDFCAFVNREYADKWKQVVVYQQDVDWQKDVDFFIYVKDEYLNECSDTQILTDANEIPCDVYKYTLVKDVYIPVTSNLVGIASWSEHQEMALDFLYRVNTDKMIANLLQYGIEGENYEVRDKRAVVNYNNPLFGSFGIQNKWITLPQLLEPEDKEHIYREYIGNHIS